MNDSRNTKRNASCENVCKGVDMKDAGRGPQKSLRRVHAPTPQNPWSQRFTTKLNWVLAEKVIPSRSSPTENKVVAEISRELAVPSLIVRRALLSGSQSARKGCLNSCKLKAASPFPQQTACQRNSLSTNMPVTCGRVFVCVCNAVRWCVHACALRFFEVSMQRCVLVCVRVCCVLMCMRVFFNAAQKYQVTSAKLECPTPIGLDVQMVPVAKNEGRPEAARPTTAPACSSDLGDPLHEAFVLVCPPPVPG